MRPTELVFLRLELATVPLFAFGFAVVEDCEPTFFAAAPLCAPLRAVVALDRRATGLFTATGAAVCGIIR